MRVLMISSTFPFPPSRGGTEIRTFNLLRYLNVNHEVTLVTQRPPDVSDEEVEALKGWVSHLQCFPLPADPRHATGLPSLPGKAARLVQSFQKGTPPNVLHRYSPTIQSWIDAYVRDGKCDVVTCEHSVNAVYVRPAFRESVQTVLNAHSLSYGWVRNHLELGASEHPWRDRLYLSLLYRYEKRFNQQFSRLVVTTEEDRQQLLAFSPDSSVWVVPNGVDLEVFPYRSQDPGGQRLIFVGAMDGSHNIDAVRFFVQEVWPHLRQRYPELTFSIVGNRPTPEVAALANQPGVIVTGRVPSMVEYLHQSTICVLPLRTGFGIKNKTLEAMAAGVPVVASDRGLEGLSVDGDRCPLRALRANHPEEYIGAISRLLDDSDLRRQLSHQARAMIERIYTWERAGRAYTEVLSHD